MQFLLEFIGTVQPASVIYSSFKNGKTWKSCKKCFVVTKSEVFTVWLLLSALTIKNKIKCVFSLSLISEEVLKLVLFCLSFFLWCYKQYNFFKIIFSNLSNSQSTYQRRLLVTRSGRKIKGRGPRVNIYNLFSKINKVVAQSYCWCY